MSNPSPEKEITEDDFPAYEEYRDSLVAFVDILGFTSEVRSVQCKCDFLRVVALLFDIKDTAERFNHNNEILKQMTMTAVSDSFVISMPCDDPVCVTALIFAILRLQHGLLMKVAHRRLLRGFLTRGRVYHHDGIVFGEGYCRAYECQGKVGHAPRIVVDPGVIQDVREKIATDTDIEEKDNVFDYLRRDPSDGLYFIDYLRLPATIKKSSSSDDETEEEYRGTDLFISENTAKYADDLTIRRKYEWLRWYLTETYGASKAASGVSTGR